MKKKVSLLSGVVALLFTLLFVILPSDIANAEMADGTHEIDYEMKEASSDSTSIADGFFTKPATLTVEDGEQHIQLTVTSSSMIQSLSAPTGEVDIVDENEEEDTRTVKFRVDQDLSEPLEMEMHIIVPDLYDMTHTARAVFDVSELENDEEGNIEEDNTEEVNEEPENDNENEEETNETSDENEMNENNNEDEEAFAENTNENAEDSEADNSTANALWITLAIVGVIIIAGIVFWIVRKNRSK